jgi:hypothetical protein
MGNKFTSSHLGGVDVKQIMHQCAQRAYCDSGERAGRQKKDQPKNHQRQDDPDY